MKLQWMYGALLAAAMVTPGSAQVSVYIGTPPPAVVYEEPGPPPGAGLFGSRDIGNPWVTVTEDIGTAKTTTTTTGGTMTAGEGMGTMDHGHEHRE